MVNVRAQDEATRDEAGLHSHHRSFASFKVAYTFTIGGNTGEVGEIIWEERGALERTRRHAILFERLVRMREVVHKDLLGCK